MDLRYLPTVDPLVGGEIQEQVPAPIISYVKTRSTILLGAELYIMVLQAAPGTKATSRGGILWVTSSSPRSCALGKACFCNSSFGRSTMFVVSVVLAWREMAAVRMVHVLRVSEGRAHEQLALPSPVL